MTRPRRRIAQLAELRRKTIQLADETVVLVEPTGLIHGEYRDMLKKGDRRQALARLILVCCEDTDGKPFFDEEEALIIASGRAEVFTPIVAGITAFFQTEKKLPPLTPIAASSSDSPSPSDAPTPTG